MLEKQLRIVERKIGADSGSLSTGLSTYLSTGFQQQKETFLSGLFLSARWMYLSEWAKEGVHIVILPSREAAEYCSADLYHLVEGDCVFFLPESGKSVERSNYKSTLGVQRTSAIGKILDYDGGLLVVVTYPEAISEGIP